jgi:hypothetical protein
LILLQTAHKAASPEGTLFYDGWLSSSPGTSPGAGASSGSAAREAEEGETALEEMEMEMQSYHGTHHRRPEHHPRPVHSDMGWKNWTQVGRPVSTKMIITREANN